MKPIIYQLLPRLFSNLNANCVPDGTIEQNGSGKLNDLTPKVLRSIRDLGVTHIWLDGVVGLNEFRSKGRALKAAPF